MPKKFDRIHDRWMHRGRNPWNIYPLQLLPSLCLTLSHLLLKEKVLSVSCSGEIDRESWIAIVIELIRSGSGCFSHGPWPRALEHTGTVGGFLDRFVEQRATITATTLGPRAYSVLQEVPTGPPEMYVLCTTYLCFPLAHYTLTYLRSLSIPFVLHKIPKTRVHTHTHTQTEKHTFVLRLQSPLRVTFPSV